MQPSRLEKAIPVRAGCLEQRDLERNGMAVAEWTTGFGLEFFLGLETGSEFGLVSVEKVPGRMGTAVSTGVVWVLHLCSGHWRHDLQAQSEQWIGSSADQSVR